MGGCSSINHSSYLHESTPQHADKAQGQLRVEASPFQQKEQLQSQTSVINPALVNTHLREQTHSTSHTDHVSLMILPALISNGKKELKVNVMLDPCSTSSYISEEAAEELELQGQASYNRRNSGDRDQDTLMTSRSVGEKCRCYVFKPYTSPHAQHCW